ncbi:CoA-binding protein [Limnobacter sp. 130]|uniref:CoA-binding protein n=1 Tax=unclassified Limnobacter TaxID=2630203 RepID=UPI0012F1B75B|nr:CoA-binding protein [Limnobacter sp. 130]VWX34984.1 CoA-binding protein [Limnobacter sp. 130]
MSLGGQPPEELPMQDAELKQLLDNTKTIAVVGFSSQAHKPSFFVAKYLQSQGYRILPINPALQGRPSGLLGETCYPDLKTAMAETGLKIDLVDVFRRAEHTPDVLAQAMNVGAGAVWLQQGIRNDMVEAKAKAAGLPFLMDRCLKTEHQRLYLV